MKVISKKIEEIINDEIKSYALYSIYNRAIPNLIDGFKPTQRKLFYAMRNFYKNKGYITVSSLAGAIREPEKGNYHHGNDAAAQTIINMTKDFSNQIPIFLGKGEFGSRLIPDGAAAPRYISVKYNPILDYIFRIEDEPILPKNLDIENPEPEFYVPIIPMILVNGASGIATGFSVNIYPRKIEEIIDEIIYILENENLRKKRILPYFKNTKIKVEYNKDFYNIMALGKYEFYADKNFRNKTNEITKYLKITEIPHLSRESTIKILNKYLDKGIIKTFKDSSKENFEIYIILNNKKLERNANIVIESLCKATIKENFVLIEPELDHNLNVFELKIKEYVDEYYYPENMIIYDFVRIRLKFYEKRIEHIKNKLKNDIDKEKKKIKFVSIAKELQGKSKKEIETILNKKFNFTKDDTEYCLSIPFYNLTKEYISKTKEKITNLEKELKDISTISTKDIYLKEIYELKNTIKN